MIYFTLESFVSFNKNQIAKSAPPIIKKTMSLSIGTQGGGQHGGGGGGAVGCAINLPEKEVNTNKNISFFINYKNNNIINTYSINSLLHEIT